MPEVRASQVLEAPADAVWRLLEDFGAIQRWWPTDGSAPIERVTVDGEGVGMVRHILNRGATHAVSERLDFIEPSTRTIVLSIIGTRPAGIMAYVAEGQVVELDAHRCRIDYRALVTTVPELEEPVRKALLKTWALMFRGLESCARRA
jgi:uncharacterized protein YndB with AHSA1/START domain